MVYAPEVNLAQSLLFGGFFAITGLHLTHVVGGIIALTVVALGYRRGRYTAADIPSVLVSSIMILLAYRKRSSFADHEGMDSGTGSFPNNRQLSRAGVPV